MNADGNVRKTHKLLINGVFMNEETKDTRMLPVQCNCAWNPDRHADSCPVNLRDRLIDAQAMLNQAHDEIARLNQLSDHDMALLTAKDARIAQLAAHARGKNKALTNALKEIERFDSDFKRLGEQYVQALHQITTLRAKLEKLQSAFPLFDETGLSETEHHCEWSVLQERKRLHAILNSATADSDVRKVK